MGEAQEIMIAWQKGRDDERERIIDIIKSHIEPTYPINCKGIIDEINDVKCVNEVKE